MPNFRRADAARFNLGGIYETQITSQRRAFERGYHNRPCGQCLCAGSHLAPAPVPAAPCPGTKTILKPWAEQVEKASGGRIKIEHFDAMSLGGRPPELMDQARDGVVDLSMTVVGYTPGRFPRTEVFELPFMMTNPVSTAAAYWEMVETDWQATEYKDVKVLGAWVHGPGVLHSKDGDQQAWKTCRA